MQSNEEYLEDILDWRNYASANFKRISKEYEAMMKAGSTNPEKIYRACLKFYESVENQPCRPKQNKEKAP